MAKLYGKLQGSNGTATRMGSDTIHSKLETWEHSIQTVLKANGDYEVSIGNKTYANKGIAVGNLEKDTAKD